MPQVEIKLLIYITVTQSMKTEESQSSFTWQSMEAKGGDCSAYALIELNAK